MTTYYDNTDDGPAGGGGGAGTPGGPNRVLYADGAGAAYVDSDDLTYDATTHDLAVEASESGGDVAARVSNTSNTASSAAVIEARVAGASAGNPSLRVRVDGVRYYDWRVNNATNDKLEMFDSVTGIARMAYDPTLGHWAINGNPLANYALAIYGNGAPASARLLIYTSVTNNASSETIWQTNAGAYMQAFAGGSGVAGTGVFGALASAGLSAILQNSVLAGGTSFALGAMSAIPVHLVSGNVVRVTVRGSNLIVGPTIAAGAETTTLGTGADGVVYVKNGALPSTAPSGGGELGSLGGHQAWASSDGGVHYVTGATNEVANADVVVTLADRETVHTATLTANHTVTLPNAATTPNGFRHRVFSPGAMGGFQIDVSGDINILGAASFAITTADTGVEFVKATANWRVL